MVDGLNTLIQSLENENYHEVGLFLTDLRDIKGGLVEFAMKIFEGSREFEPPVGLGSIYNNETEGSFTDPTVRAWKAANQAYFGDWSKGDPNVLNVLSDSGIQDYNKNIYTATALLANALVTAAAIDPRIKGEEAGNLKIVSFGFDENFDPLEIYLPGLQEVYKIVHKFYQPNLVGDAEPLEKL